MMKSFLSTTLDFAFPWACGLCGTGDTKLRSGAFCCDCQQQLTRPIENSCQRCAAEVGRFVATSDGCVHCRKSRLKFDSVTCLGMYDEAMRRVILSSKWSFSAVGITALAQLFASEAGDRLKQLDVDLIVPIPQSWQKRIVRRFNSAQVVSEVLSKTINVPHDVHILRRRRNVRPQKRVPVQQRMQNQQDAFRIRDAHLLAGKRILVVDDVMTTGATCNEAVRMLRSHGAKACHVAILARVLDGSA